MRDEFTIFKLEFYQEYLHMLLERVSRLFEKIIACRTTGSIIETAFEFFTGMQNDGEKPNLKRLDVDKGLFISFQQGNDINSSKNLLLGIRIDDLTLKRKKPRWKDAKTCLKGEHVIKSFIIAECLCWLETIMLTGQSIPLGIFLYDITINPPKLMDILAECGLDESLVLLLEPTSNTPCMVEKGYSRTIIKGDPSDLATIKRNLEENFSPSHPIYPVDMKNPLSFRFLPGAEYATITSNNDSFSMQIHHQPFQVGYKQNVFDWLENAGISKKNIIENIYFQGARFNPNHEIFSIFEDSYEKVFSKKPYLEWHPNPSFASILHKSHPETCTIIIGPGNPFLKGSRKERLEKKDADAFHDFLATILAKFGPISTLSF